MLNGKMRKRYLIYLILTLIVCSCGLEDTTAGYAPDVPIEFKTSKVRVITKSGDDAQKFDIGTKYKLFAVAAAEGTDDWGNTIMNDIEGEESAQGVIDYGEKKSYGLFPCNILNFYGVTYGNTESVTVASNAYGNRVVNVSLKTDGTLEDLMYSNNLKSKNASSGILNMEFAHTLSKLKFEIIKQDETADADKKLTNATLKKVILMGTGGQGTFNIATGKWENITTQDRVVYDGTFAIENSPKNFAECLALPVSDGDVTLRIYLDGIEGGQEFIDYTLAYDQSNKLRLESNKEYTLSVVVLKNDVRIVTVTPKVYEWIDVELDNDDAYLGQPVFFANLMWMDRNLGAKTADCENDWYNSIGYYYQFGRNIPFILDVKKWLAYIEDDDQKDMQKANILKVREYTIKDKHPQWDTYPVEKQNTIKKNLEECIYSLDHKGEKVYGFQDNISGANDNLIRFIGDVILNGDNTVNDDKTKLAYRFGAGGTGKYKSFWTNKDSYGQNYWKDVDNQPCPKGWRLPTKEDLYSFMPLKQANWASNGNKYPVSMHNTLDGYTEDVRLGWIESAQGRYNVCYILKNPGPANAYRIMIKSHFAKKINGEGYSTNKRYITISRYTASKNDKIEDYTSSTYNEAIASESKENTLWNNPVEVTSFPGCGYMVPDAVSENSPDVFVDFRSFGWGTIMRTSDPYGSTNYVQYLSVSDYQLSVQSSSRRSLGDQIRCVRDINVEW